MSDKFDCNIEGVTITDVIEYSDSRGWLVEIFRRDQLKADLHPAMGYISMTLPGQVRGPHEHKEQTDLFCLIGPSDFKVVLWDNRENSKTYGEKYEFIAGESNKVIVIVPPGIVHGYKNIGKVEGLVINAPNQLYAGEGKSDPVDEIRYENISNSKFII